MSRGNVPPRGSGPREWVAWLTGVCNGAAIAADAAPFDEDPARAMRLLAEALRAARDEGLAYLAVKPEELS